MWFDILFFEIKILIYIMRLYKFLYNCLQIKDINDLLKYILENHSLFLDIKKLDGSLFDIQKFKSKIYSKSEDTDNILVMYRLVELLFYNLVEVNAKKKLLYKEEIKNDTSDNSYLVFLTDNDLHLNIFKCYMLFYYANIRLNMEKMYIILDCEFNTKVLALMQINFEQSRKDLFNKSLIFLFHPNQLSIKWNSFFIEKILCKDNVYKILHGSDSLDIRVIYENLLKSKDLIIKFNRCFIDTKFLCEYNFFRKGMELGKCKIDYLLLNENITSQEVFDKVQSNSEAMGHIYDIIIDITKMSPELITYTMYDVVFLGHLIFHFKKEIPEFSLINELVQLSLLDKRNILQIVPKDEINKMNNYITIVNHKPIKLINLFNILSDKFIKKYLLISNILKVNYIKSTLIIILKYEIYKHLCRKYVIYLKYTDKIKYNNKILKLTFDYQEKEKVIKVIDKLKSVLP